MRREIKPLIPVSQEGWEDTARSLLEGNPANPNNSAGSIVLPANINRSDYIQIPGHNVVIARAETLKGLNLYGTLEKLKTSNLRAPKVRQFLDHFVNVLSAAEGKSILLDAGGNPISRDDAKDLWKYISSGHRGGCWTWLDALFKQDKGKFYMETDLSVVRSGNNISLQGKHQTLDTYVQGDVYVDLKFTKQGFPISQSGNQKYNQGKNIKFYQPRVDAVAVFLADSDVAGLYCCGNPTITSSQLGVFACAEGTAVAKNGVIK